MPPQQDQRLLDLFHAAFGFRAHESPLPTPILFGNDKL
jgi:hypothetical protein